MSTCNFHFNPSLVSASVVSADEMDEQQPTSPEEKKVNHFSPPVVPWLSPPLHHP